jgi:hypothetical protein
LQESAAELKHYLALDPDYVFGHGLLALDYAALGHEDAVRIEAAEVERLLVLEPDSSPGAPAIFALATTRYAEGKPVEALAALEKTMWLDSRHRVDYLWVEGLAYSQMARWEEGISAFKDFWLITPIRFGLVLDWRWTTLRPGAPTTRGPRWQSHQALSSALSEHCR